MITVPTAEKSEVILARAVLFSAVIALGLWSGIPALAADGASRSGSGFADVSRESGVSEAMARHYERHPKWWLSGLNLVDLDGDGHLDLFLAAHGAGTALALLNDGHGHFHEASGSYPTTEIHLAYDINEDGKLDLQMTWQDGGGKWWLNESRSNQLSFRETAITAGQGRANAMIDLNRDGNVDWLHERPGVVFEFGDGKGNFKPGGNLEVAPTRNEINMHPADLNGDGLIDLALHWGRYDYERGKSRVYLSERKNEESQIQNSNSETGDNARPDERSRSAESKIQNLKSKIEWDGLAIKGVGDVNQDGTLDLMVLENKMPELYLNNGQGNFARKPGAFGAMTSATKPHYVSWGLAVVADFDNDGVVDIIWNGRNFLWLWRGTGGGSFNYANKIWGIEDKSAASVDDGLCFGDIDSDGDLDIVGYTGSLDSQRQIRIYRNELPAQNWLRVRLAGAPGNHGAAGAKIRLTDPSASGGWTAFEQVMILDSQSAHSYYGLMPTERHFGLGPRATVDVSVEFYPSGKRISQAAQANSTITLAEKRSVSLREINPPPATTNRTVAIVGATLIDGRGGAPTPDAVVVMLGEKILAAGTRSSTDIPRDAEIVDAAGLTLLPGLIDAHFHVERDFELPRLYLSHGVTALRDPGQWIEVYDPIRQSKLLQPRCFVAGPHLDCPPHAHPRDAFSVTNADDTRRAVNRFVDQGASVIKVYYRLPLDLIGVACAAAHDRGVPVTTHLELVDADAAIHAGVDGIEHVTSFGTALAEPGEAERFRRAVAADNEARRRARYELWSQINLDDSPRVQALLKLVVDRKVFLSPTLAVFERREIPADGITARGGTRAVEAQGFAKMLRFVGLCHRAGVRIVVGSHSSVPGAERGWAFQREMELLVECGLTPMEAIVAATRNNAEYFRVDGRLGTIEQGKLADLVLVAGDPRQDIRAMRNVRGVMLHGQWVVSLRRPD